MEYSKQGLQLTESFEGCKLTSYQDVKGVWTIGYGHTGPEVGPNQTIDQATAEELLDLDIQHSVNAVNAVVKVPLTQNQFDACVDFVYNCGAANYDHSTLLKKINLGDFEGADQEFKKWNRSGGIVYAGLTRRRDEEAALFGTA